MKTYYKIITLLTCVVLTNSCEALKSSSNEGRKPIEYLENGSKINIKSLLDGNLDSFAVLFDENDKIENVFVGKIDGKWEGNKGTVRYDYIFSGGVKDARTWLISLNEDKTFSAIGHDAISPADGRQVGNVAEMIYTLLIPHKNMKQKVEFTDRVFAVDEKSAIIISRKTVNGKHIGKAVISIKKSSRSPAQQSEKPTVSSGDSEKQ
jgi:hypothetical protein